MARFLKAVYWIYALIFVLVVIVGIASVFGFFDHQFMDPGV